jgi:hypothetical protein
LPETDLNAGASILPARQFSLLETTLNEPLLAVSGTEELSRFWDFCSFQTGAALTEGKGKDFFFEKKKQKTFVYLM